MKKQAEPAPGAVTCKCLLNGGNSNVTVVVVIPCQTPGQRLTLMRNIPRIKSHLYMHIDRREVDVWAKNNDLRGVKERFRQIINETLPEPIKTVYLDYWKTY
jgi:hypothetical protein